MYYNETKFKFITFLKNSSVYRKWVQYLKCKGAVHWKQSVKIVRNIVDKYNTNMVRYERTKCAADLVWSSDCMNENN
jgi:hypothetical protein